MSFSQRTSRRALLQSAAVLGGASLLPSFAPRARATAITPRKLVMVLNAGGWDPTFVFDPKPGLPLVDAPAGQLANIGGHTIWSDPTRNNVDAFFSTYGGITAVINGVQVRSFVHSDCMKRVLTGSPSETTPDMGAIAAYELGAGMPVPYLALGAYSRSGPYAAITGRAGTTNQLQALVDPAAAYGPETGPYAPSFGTSPSNAEDGAVRRFLEATAKREQKIRGQRGYNKKRIDDFIASLGRADTLSRFVREGASLGERGYTPDLNFQIPLAVQALSEGLSHTAMLQSAPSWDTHTQNDYQGAYFQDLFGSLAALMQALDAANLLDTTTVMVLSEMGRTPKLNGDAGKDHWPVTSCMLIGAGVAGGRSYGGTTDALGAESIDLATGEVDANGLQLQTQNLVAGVLENVGVDPEPYFKGVEAFRGFRG
jgi:hypothetical protein